MQRITPFLWYTDDAEDAAAFYTSIFKDGKIIDTMPGPEGKAMSVTIEILGQQFIAFNGGRHDDAQAFNMGVSFFVSCKDQAEVDRYWEGLSADGGETSKCGWLRDKFGVWWQIIPDALVDYMTDNDPVKIGRVTEAMLKMDKIVIKELDDAYEGK